MAPSFKKVNGTSKPTTKKTKNKAAGVRPKEKPTTRKTNKSNWKDFIVPPNDSDCYSLNDVEESTSVNTASNTELQEFVQQYVVTDTQATQESILQPVSLFTRFDNWPDFSNRPTPSATSRPSSSISVAPPLPPPLRLPSEDDHVVVELLSNTPAGPEPRFDFSIPTGVPEVDEIQRLIDVCQKTGCGRPTGSNPTPSIWDPINEMLINFIYSLAGATVGREQQVTNAFDYRILIATEAERIFNNITTKKCFVEGFLEYIDRTPSENGTYSWPPFFIDRWIQEKNNPKLITDSWKERNEARLAGMSEKEILFYAWCNHIESKFALNKRVITGVLSKEWVAAKDLRSGQNLTAMYQNIRKVWYYKWGCDLANGYIVQEKAKKKKKKENPMTEKEQSDLYNDRVKAHMDKYDPNHIRCFPKEWLTFLFIGKPDHIGLGTMEAFNCGREVDDKSNIPSSLIAGGKSAALSDQPSDTIIHSKQIRKHVMSLSEYSKEANDQNKKRSTKNEHTPIICHHHIPYLERRESTNTSSITASSLHQNNDEEDQLRNCHLVLKNIKRQKASLVDSIKRNRELGNLEKVDMLNQKLDDVESIEFQKQDEITEILCNRNRKVG